MDDYNSDNVVYREYGQDMRKQQPSAPPYQNQIEYNISPEGYAGYTDYIKNRGEDSKYGAVPRFDAMQYDQFQPPHPDYVGNNGPAYGQPYAYGAPPYPQRDAAYGGYPQNGYNHGQEGYGYGQHDGYNRYGGPPANDWHTGSVPYPQPYESAYNAPRIQEQQPYPPGYDPYMQQSIPGYPEEQRHDVVNDIVGQGYAPQQYDGSYSQYIQQYNAQPQGQYDTFVTGQFPHPQQQPLDFTGQLQLQKQMTGQFAVPQQPYGQEIEPFAMPQPPASTTGQFSLPYGESGQAGGIRPPVPQPPQGLFHTPETYAPAQPFQPEQQPVQRMQPEQVEKALAEQPASFDTAVFSIKDIQPITQQFDIVPPEDDIGQAPEPSAVQRTNEPVQAAGPFAFGVSATVSNIDAPTQQPFAPFGAQPQPAPATDPFASFGAPPEQQVSDPFGGAQPQPAPAADPFASFGAQPEQQASDPFGGAQPQPAPAADPFASFGAQPEQQASDPFGGAQPQPASAADPFASFGAQPEQQASDLFGGAQPQPATEAKADTLGSFGEAFAAQTRQGDMEITQEIALPQKDSAANTTVSPQQEANPFSGQDSLFATAFADPSATQAQAEQPLWGSFGAEQQAGTVQTISPESFAGAHVAPEAPTFGDAKQNQEQTQSENLLSRDLPGNIFESSFQIDDQPKAKAPMRETEIFRIAEELSQAVLVKSHSRAYNDNNLMPESDKRILTVDRISSEYHISEGGTKPYQMYANITFQLNAGSCCALVSDVPLAAYALARSICESADQDYDDEPVRVSENAEGEQGQIMYIGSDSMLPEEMTCEEFLLYIKTGNEDEEDETEKERLTILLSQIGMSDIQQTDLRDLSYNKRILLITLAATLNPKIVCVVINDPKFRVDAEEEMLARRVFALLNNRGKSSLIACCSAYLMAAVTNRVAVIRKGQLVFFDTYKKFVEENCRGIMSFNVDKPDTIAQQLEAKYPSVQVLCKENLVYIIKKKGAPDIDLESLIKDIIGFGADYNSIVMDEKSFVMACKEVLGNR